MTTLPPPSVPAAILSFDFDGTLHYAGEDPPVPAGFFRRIRELREERGVLWGINTGRSLPQMLDGILESRFPVLPDWVVAREREIHFPNNLGRWLPHKEWNKRCEKEIHALFKHARKLMKRIRREIEDHTGAGWYEMEGEPAGVIAQSEEEMEWIVDRIQPLASAEPQLGWQRNSIYLRFGHRDFQKGSSLSRVAGHFGLPTASCFAIGDSHNDFEMLDPAHAGMIACPANAVEAIKEKVRANGGLVTRASHGQGVIEALDYFFQ